MYTYTYTYMYTYIYTDIYICVCVYKTLVFKNNSISISRDLKICIYTKPFKWIFVEALFLKTIYKNTPKGQKLFNG